MFTLVSFHDRETTSFDNGLAHSDQVKDTISTGLRKAKDLRCDRRGVR